MARPDEHHPPQPEPKVDKTIANRAIARPRCFPTLIYALLLGTVICSAYFLLSGWSPQQESAQKPANHQPQIASQRSDKPTGTPAGGAKMQGAAKRIDAGQKLFATNCAACHGADASGNSGPDLTDQTFTFGGSKEDLTTSISKGRPGGMPAFADQLSGAQIADLVAFIQSR